MIILTVDLRVIDMSDFDVILGMDWLTAHRVVIDCDRRRVIANTQDDVCGVRPLPILLLLQYIQNINTNTNTFSIP